MAIDWNSYFDNNRYFSDDELDPSKEEFSTGTSSTVGNSHTERSGQSVTQKHQDRADVVGYEPQKVKTADYNAYANMLGKGRAKMLDPNEIARKEQQQARIRAASDLGYWLGVMGTNGVTNTAQGSATAPVATYKDDPLYVRAMKDYLGALPNYQKYLNDQNKKIITENGRLASQDLKDKNAALRAEANALNRAAEFYAGANNRSNLAYSSGNGYSVNTSNAESNTSNTSNTSRQGHSIDWARDNSEGGRKQHFLTSNTRPTEVLLVGKDGYETAGFTYWKEGQDFVDFLSSASRMNPENKTALIQYIRQDMMKRTNNQNFADQFALDVENILSQQDAKSLSDIDANKLNHLNVVLSDIIHDNAQVFDPRTQGYLKKLKFVPYDKSQGKVRTDLETSFAEYKTKVINGGYQLPSGIPVKNNSPLGYQLNNVASYDAEDGYSISDKKKKTQVDANWAALMQNWNNDKKDTKDKKGK